jgi:hypothetical protein
MLALMMIYTKFECHPPTKKNVKLTLLSRCIFFILFTSTKLLFLKKIATALKDDEKKNTIHAGTRKQKKRSV